MAESDFQAPDINWNQSFLLVSCFFFHFNFSINFLAIIYKFIWKTLYRITTLNYFHCVWNKQKKKTNFCHLNFITIEKRWEPPSKWWQNQIKKEKHLAQQKHQQITKNESQHHWIATGNNKAASLTCFSVNVLLSVINWLNYN